MTNNNIFGKPSTGIAMLGVATVVLVVVTMTLNALSGQQQQAILQTKCIWVYGQHPALAQLPALLATDTQKGIFITTNAVPSESMASFKYVKHEGTEVVYEATPCN